MEEANPFLSAETPLIDHSYDQAFYKPTEIHCDFEVTLISRDGVRFRANANVLRMASPVFKTMFALPQPEGNTEAVASSLDESAIVIKSILSILLGRPCPDIRFNFGLLQGMALAAEKWDMRGLLCVIRQMFLNNEIAQQHPIGLYCVGCRFGWPEVSQLGSSYSCSNDLLSERSQVHLRRLPSACNFVDLMNFHQKRKQSVKSHIEESRNGLNDGSNSRSWDLEITRFKNSFVQHMETLPARDLPSYSDILHLLKQSKLAYIESVKLNSKRFVGDYIGPCVQEFIINLIQHVNALPKSINEDDEDQVP